MIQSFRNSWTDFVPFLDFPLKIRKLICTTNAIESLNARFWAATRRRGHLSNEQSALKMLHLAVIERRHNRINWTREIAGWKATLNTPAITYNDRLGLN